MIEKKQADMTEEEKQAMNELIASMTEEEK